MIVIDVIVPVLNETYNVRVDDNNTVSKFLEELIPLLARKTGDEGYESSSGFALFSVQKGELLESGKPLFVQGVRDGSRLILV